MEIPTVIASFCWSLPICKKSDLLFWITLNTSDHFHLKWLKVLLLLLPYHMQKTNFITQLILEIKLTHYSGHILAVSCLRKSHTWDCSFSKYFQILYIFAQIFKYFALFALCLKNRMHVLLFWIIKNTKAAETLFS